MHPVDIHKLACERANEVVPVFEIGSDEHERWLQEYDRVLRHYYGPDKSG